MKKGILILFFVFLMAAVGMSSCGANSTTSSNNSPLDGSWECSFVMYDGEQLMASEEQASDYTLKVNGESFQANIYGEETAGTVEFITSIDLGDDGDVDTYTFTTDSGATIPVWHYRKYDTVLFYMFGEASSDDYIAFEKASH